ncbi:complex I NDUFA9 subunit family protein [Enterovirga rhinocerotis]|uniref:NADH dehydrogenase n=1 Tax=Enterovirga rhinocerotis TaxID=1339210 RepID=A0A4R7CAW6_9HYPH|nr:complex I NDUFA9 subunit family protein [Enterovirga rhinocerotis]TDR95896.1 NADH dehydrogenase [Enterovirga rhinocerotis]
MDAIDRAPKLVTVFGGSGFLGRHVVHALAQGGYRVRVAVRRPDLAYFLQPLGRVGQIQVVQANLRYPRSIEAAAAGADAVVNLVGILAESGRQRFHAVQAEGPNLIAQATPADAMLVHVSALGASLHSASRYAHSKAEGEAAVHTHRPDAIILRPSVMFGKGDTFFNRFAALARALPVLPLAGADTKFQPAFVGDVAQVVARAVSGTVPAGRIYELGGPEVKTLRELVEYVLAVTERERVIAPLPFGLAKVQARVLSLINALTLGLMPAELKLTVDQVELLRTDNVVSEAAIAEGRSFEGLGIAADTFAAVAPSYLGRFRKTGQFDIARAA